MRPTDDIERMIENLRLSPSAAADERILAAAAAALGQSHTWRKIMSSTWTKLAVAAATIVIIVGLSATFFTQSARPAYALEQTVEANKGIRSIHVRHPSPPENTPQDTWLEFDENGSAVLIRVEEGTNDSYRILVSNNDKVKRWWPSKNEFTILYASGLRRVIERQIEKIDPVCAVNTIYALASKGEVTIEVEHSASEIRLTATQTKSSKDVESKRYHVRYVLLVDPETKLVRQRDVYRLKGDHYELEDRCLYLEYNQPIDPQMFALEPPTGAKVNDRTQGRGMPQGDLTDDQAAAEVVRRFIEAIATKDYDRATQFSERATADDLRKHDERIKVINVRFISTGEPIPVPDSGPRFFDVPFTFEIETASGKREIVGPPVESGPGPRTHRKARVGPLVDQPDRWVIYGGL